jgi:ketosteroid isomerase-like protein
MPQTLTPGDGHDLLARFGTAWESRDPDGAVALFAEDAEARHDPFEPPLVGSKAIRERWNRVAAEQGHVEFDAERVWVSGMTVLASWHAAYSLRASGRRLRARGFMTLELGADGLVTRLREWSVTREVGTDHGLAVETPSVGGVAGEEHE